MMTTRETALRTPDGRYLVVRGTLWRCSDPTILPAARQALVNQLMKARRSVALAKDAAERKAARRAVDEAKHALGERGPVWWTDDAPDYTRRKVQNSPYAEWYDAVKIAGLAER